MHDRRRPRRVTGHVQVRGPAGARKYVALYVDRDGVDRTRTLGPAHVRDSGRRKGRGAVIWRAAGGPCPPGHLTPKVADDALAALLAQEREAPPTPPPTADDREPAVLTFGELVEDWIAYLEVEKRRKPSTVQDARNTARAYLLPRFGVDTPLYRVERHDTIVMRDGRPTVERREERHDTITTEDVDAFRRELLRTKLSPRSVQKTLVLLHGLLKLGKRRKLIAANPAEDAERVSVVVDDDFNILEPVEFEAVHRAVLGQEDQRPVADCSGDVIAELGELERQTYAAALSTAFYLGVRLGELRDLTFGRIDFARCLVEIASSFTHSARSTTKGNRTRSVPLVPQLAQRLAALAGRGRFTADSDYVFCDELGRRLDDAALRKVFYAALVRAGLGAKRATEDAHGNPQRPIRFHDLRHSYCTWAVNAYDVTLVQKYAGHRDIKTTMRYVHRQAKTRDAEVGGAYLDRVLAADAAAVA